MQEEKIRCEFCGRSNSTSNDLCKSCGAKLPSSNRLRFVTSNKNSHPFIMSGTMTNPFGYDVEEDEDD